MGASKELTIKQFKFALKYVETGNATEAYKQAYDWQAMKPDTIYVAAQHVLNNNKVKVKIEQLKDQYAKKHGVTVDSLTQELDENRSIALQLGQPAAANGASLGKAKLHGHLVDRSESKVMVKIIESTPEQIAERLSQLLGITLDIEPEAIESDESA